MLIIMSYLLLFFKQKTAYEMRISDWSSDVCSSDLGEEQAARQTTLRLETRANVRAGNFDALPNLFVQYVENGGDVKYFTRWYKDAMESALETRSERRLTDLMKNDRKMASVNRLIDAGVQPLDEDRKRVV